MIYALIYATAIVAPQVPWYIITFRFVFYFSTFVFLILTAIFVSNALVFALSIIFQKSGLYEKPSLIRKLVSEVRMIRSNKFYVLWAIVMAVFVISYYISNHFIAPTPPIF